MPIGSFGNRGLPLLEAVAGAQRKTVRLEGAGASLEVCGEPTLPFPCACPEEARAREGCSELGEVRTRKALQRASWQLRRHSLNDLG